MAATVTCCGIACEVPRFVDLKGFLGFWVLWELRLGPLQGPQLAERLAWRRGDPLSPGTLYPTLAALTQDGLLRKRKDGREARYDLTATGLRDLQCAAWYVQAVFRDVFATPVVPTAAPAKGPSPARR